MTRVSDHLLARLADEGIDTAFLYYGGAISEIADAFTRQSKIRYIVPMTEMCCAFAAEGYAKASGRPGVAVATSGPGGQNMVTGIANCFYDSVPTIFITGQVSTKFMRPTRAIRQLGFQEWPVTDCVREITKSAITVLDASIFPQLLDSAIRICKEGRLGPCLLDIPTDIARSEI